MTFDGLKMNYRRQIWDLQLNERGLILHPSASCGLVVEATQETRERNALFVAVSFKKRATSTFPITESDDEWENALLPFHPFINNQPKELARKGHFDFCHPSAEQTSK